MQITDFCEIHILCTEPNFTVRWTLARDDKVCFTLHVADTYKFQTLNSKFQQNLLSTAGDEICERRYKSPFSRVHFMYFVLTTFKINFHIAISNMMMMMISGTEHRATLSAMLHWYIVPLLSVGGLQLFWSEEVPKLIFLPSMKSSSLEVYEYISLRISSLHTPSL